MRVGVFLSSFVPEIGGGYTFERDVFNALQELVETSNHEFYVFRPGHLAGTMIEGERNNGMKEVVYSQPNIVDRSLDWLTRNSIIVNKILKRQSFVDRLLEKENIEFLWFVSQTICPVDVPYLTVVWDLQHRVQPWFPEVSSKGKWSGRERVHSESLRRAAFVIVGTEAGKTEVEWYYQIPQERIKILPHPTPQFSLAPRDSANDIEVINKYRLPTNYLLYPAQFWPHKNHANLLMAVRVLIDEHNLAVPVVLVGSDKGNQSHIRQLVITLGLSDLVHFLGFVPVNDLVALYRNALALTYLSFFGPENLPPLEAFALGCPVVASNVSGAQEQLGDAALLVDPRNQYEIAMAIKNLHDQPDLRQELVVKGRIRASRWTSHDFVRGILSIIDEFQTVRRCWGTRQ